MEYLEAARDLSKRMDALMEEVQVLIERVQDLPLGVNRGASYVKGFAGDLARAGWTCGEITAYVNKLSRTITRTRQLAQRTKSETEFLAFSVNDAIAKTH